MQIVIIGSGNAATALGHLCFRGGNEILQVFGRNRQTVTELAGQLQAQAVFNWNEISRQADLYIIALPDSLLPGLHEHFSLKKGIAVHTAGAVPMRSLEKVSPNHGVLYPLQSLHKKLMAYSNIPLLIDGNTPEDKTLVADFAATLSGRVAYANDEQRLKMHLAAVWVNNFTNYLYTIAWDFCQREGLDFSLLLPMMEQTVTRLHEGKPADFQTGPAIRGDEATLQKHLLLMEDMPGVQQLYRQLSAAIAAYHLKSGA